MLRIVCTALIASLCLSTAFADEGGDEAAAMLERAEELQEQAQEARDLSYLQTLPPEPARKRNTHWADTPPTAREMRELHITPRLPNGRQRPAIDDEPEHFCVHAKTYDVRGHQDGVLEQCY